MDLTPKSGGGGVSFGKNVDLCTVPYGAFGPRGGGSSDPQTPPLATGLRRESISRRTAEMETPDRPVASHPGGGGGGSELGWVEHYRSIQGMVGLSRIMAETRSLAPIAVDG